MDATAAARMSDPALNPHFRRRWQEAISQAPNNPVTPTEPALAAVDDRLQRLACLLQAEWRRTRMLTDGGVR